MWTAEKLRREFVLYFEKDKHIHWRSSSVQPDDPTLLFTNSGMVQFKKKFLGLEERNTAYGKMEKACNYQRCIRAGGKHNDLDDVGKDTYHHTFFEMLGNWSFGDYFKEHAIEKAWAFLTEILGLKKEQIYVSYFRGEKDVPADIEVQNIWSKYIPKERVLGYGAKENFWEMGHSGPCGPCTEIHYDRVGGRDASALVNADDPDVLEIWNIVFIQYNKEENGKLEMLPKKHVDTGMGLERVLSILQGHRSNYQTDLFMPLFEEMEKRMGTGKYGDSLCSKLDISYRVVADHSRTLAIALMDGVIPSSEGKGYVMRRILRRALGFQYMHIKKETGLLPALVRMCIEQFREVYFLDATGADIEKAVQIVKEEEAQFTKTLARGVDILEQHLQRIKSSEEKIISGTDAFILYDRYGFPIDLTVAVAEQEGIAIDIEGFHKKQLEAKEASKPDSVSTPLALTIHDLAVLSQKYPEGTEDKYKYTIDIGVCSKVLGVKVNNELIKTEDILQHRDLKECGIVLEKTSFYGEAGGQEGDTGKIFFSNIEDPSQCSASFFTVRDTKKFGKYVLHIGSLEREVLPYGRCLVDTKRRKKLAASHTSTHILNFVLYTLGEMHTCGSLVSEGRLRLDFTWPRPLKLEEIEAIERRMNKVVEEKEKVSANYMSYKEAMKIKGVRTLKGEEYPEKVRVISIGESTVKSVELCGGTHVSNTEEIQRIRIVSEMGKARGVRRICALVGEDALQAEERAKRLLNKKLGTKEDAVEIREALETQLLPTKEAQEIKERIVEYQRRAQQEKKAHFEREAQRLKESAEKQEGPFVFECAQEETLTPSLIGKGLSMLAGILEKEKRSGIVMYAGDSSVSLCASCPNAAEVLKDALKEDSSLTAGGKGNRAFGTTKLSSDKAALLLIEQLRKI